MHTPLGVHVMLRLADRRVIATSPAAYRLASRCLLEHGRERGLLAFRVVDTHIHALLLADRPTAGAFARYASAAMSKRLHLGAPFDRAHFEAVRSQGHLFNTFHYVLRQEVRHGIALDRHHDGSCLPDLVGARVIAPWLALRVAAHLPRLDPSELGLATSPFTVSAALELLADAAASAFGLPSVERSREAERVAARRAAVSALPMVKLEPIAHALGVTASTIHRLRAEPAPGAHVTAVRLQLATRAHIATTARRPARHDPAPSSDDRACPPDTEPPLP